jgi:PAS domain S-box-containing protein
MSGNVSGNPSCIEAGILDNALVIIAVLEKGGRVVTWNQAAEMITGYTRDEVIGGTEIWKRLYPEKEYRNAITKKIAGILSTRDYFENLETEIRTRSGDSRFILWNTREIEDAGIPKTIAVGIDITDQKELDAFRGSIIDNAYVLITVLNPKGNILIWNKAAEVITGYSRGEVLGKQDIWKNLYPDAGYRHDVTRQIADIIAKHQYFENLETMIRTKNGESRIISWNTRQIEAGGTYNEIAIGRDITDQKRTEEALVAYMTEIAMRIKHPVTVIGDNLQDMAGLVRSGKLSEEDIARLLETQVRNAHQVATNVLEFQRAIAEKNKAIPEAYREFLER